MATLEENELAFFAQDDDGNIWHFGQYPEEYDGEEIVKTPTWIAGLHGARPGVDDAGRASAAHPELRGGLGVFRRELDRSRQGGSGRAADVRSGRLLHRRAGDRRVQPRRAGCTTSSSTTRQASAASRVGWRGAKEEEREVLVLVSLEHLSATQMEEVRRTVLAQEARAYDISPDVYGTTQPIDQA